MPWLTYRISMSPLAVNVSAWSINVFDPIGRLLNATGTANEAVGTLGPRQGPSEIFLALLLMSIFDALQGNG